VIQNIEDINTFLPVFSQALRKAGLSDPSNCYFVDDKRANVDAAKSLGWGSCVHFCEHGSKVLGSRTSDNGVIVISDLEQLRDVWPEIFTTGTTVPR
jgi:pyrimidine and pyridine-specific 5'-nucleotidase